MMFNKNKKAQGMSMNVIIIAVIALVVLIVLVLIFTGKLKIFGQGTSETSAQYSTKACVVPGTSNECMDEYSCNQRGGSWRSPPPEGFSDNCYEGCCST